MNPNKDYVKIKKKNLVLRRQYSTVDVNSKPKTKKSFNKNYTFAKSVLFETIHLPN